MKNQFINQKSLDLVKNHWNERDAKSGIFRDPALSNNDATKIH